MLFVNQIEPLHQFYQQNLMILGTNFSKNFRQISQVIDELLAKEAFVPFIFLFLLPVNNLCQNSECQSHENHSNFHSTFK